jgi:hypothetical protein
MDPVRVDEALIGSPGGFGHVSEFDLAADPVALMFAEVVGAAALMLPVAH